MGLKAWAVVSEVSAKLVARDPVAYGLMARRFFFGRILVPGSLVASGLVDGPIDLPYAGVWAATVSARGPSGHATQPGHLQ